MYVEFGKFAIDPAESMCVGSFAVYPFSLSLSLLVCCRSEVHISLNSY
jgi:hypothetical protein